MNTIKVKAGNSKYSELVIHPDKAAMIGLERIKFAYVCFGSRKYYVNVKKDSGISRESILLSQKVMDELHIPDYPTYEICAKGKEIIIGPYIGLLASTRNEKLTESRLNKMMTYVREYHKLHGAIVVFALNSVDTENHLIEGYCYNPEGEKWQKGIFPYPSAIYRSIGLNERWKNHFLSIIGDKIFNSRYFSKWEMYQWFSELSKKNINIPYTFLYQSYQEVMAAVEKHGKVYIKPVLGLQGRKVVQVSKEGKTYVFRYREQGRNHEIRMEKPGDAAKFIQKSFMQNRYLVQPGIDLLKYRGQIIDFRCVVQKDQAARWVCKAIIGRCGEKGSVVSNISSGGTAFRAEEILDRVLPSSDVPSMEEKIRNFALEVCNTLDELGINCGDLGVDVGVDTQGCLWLIEINNRDPDPTIALNIKDRQLYYDLKAGRLYYAKALAGFESP